MSYLKLRDVKSGQVYEFDTELVRVGREPGQELVLTGETARVTSGHHAQFAFSDRAWTVEDLGSSNGTFIDEKRIAPGSPQPVEPGHTIGFGGGGPRLVVDAVEKRATPRTVIEHAGSRPARPSAPTEKISGLADLAPPQPASEKPRVRLSAPTERMRGVDADAAVAEARAHHHDAPTAPPMPPPKPAHDDALPPPLPPPPPRPSHSSDHAPRASAPAASPRASAPPPAPHAAPVAPPAAATTVNPAAGAKPAHSPSGAEKTASIILREMRNNQTFSVRGTRIRIGRGDECELRPVAAGDTSVSRIHAELVLRPEGGVVLRDNGSRNGTILNGKPITKDELIYRGDLILLGEGGPELKIEEMHGPGVIDPPRDLTPRSLARRSFGGKGATAFMRELVTETQAKSSSKLRWVIWSFVLALIVLAVVGWFYLQAQAEKTNAAFKAERDQFSAAQALADSQRKASEAETQRLSRAMDSARSGSASSAVLDSIRRQLTDQQQRTANLDSSLRRARSDLSRQQSAADSQRAVAAREMQRVQAQLEKAQQSSGGASNAQVAAWQRQLDSMSHRYSQLGDQVRAMKGADLGAVAQANQAAVGLITTWFGAKGYDGTGFVITASGYMVTNRHVALEPHTAAKPDSIQVQMADQRTLLSADLVDAAPANGPDIAVLKIRRYAGPHLTHIDWTDSTVKQGEPGVLIGFPAGLSLGLDRNAVARTSVSSGTFSQVQEDRITFNGFTVGGSSGSPVFNADGYLVGLHRAGFVNEGTLAVGLGFAVPIKDLLTLLPADAKAELGLR